MARILLYLRSYTAWVSNNDSQRSKRPFLIIKNKKEEKRANLREKLVALKSVFHSGYYQATVS